MLNLPNIAYLAYKSICEKYGEPNFAPSELELNVSEEIIDFLQNISDGQTFDIYHESTLEFENEINASQSAGIISENFSETESSNKCFSKYSYEYMKKVVSFAWTPAGHRRKEKYIQNCFRNPDLTYRTIYRMKNYVENEGNRNQKIQQIKSAVFENFLAARRDGIPVHDTDLQAWAIEANQKIQCRQFTASKHFITNFKTKFGITGRKITKLVSKQKLENSETIENQAMEFVHFVSEKMMNCNPNYIINSDQCGFSKELAPNRTLSFRGEKHTHGLIQSSNAISHSYTVQPAITMSGTLLPKFLLILQEPTGEFGSRVRINLLTPQNAIMTCTKSGKSSTSLHNLFLDEIIKPTLRNENAILLLDSWSGHHKKGTGQFLSFGTNNCEIFILPPGTTPLIQPCDVFFFRQWKYLAKRISSYVILHYHEEINLYERNNIIKLQCLIHNQLSASIYQDMIKYAWWKSTYPLSKPQMLLTVKQCCFSFQNDSSCYIMNCYNTAFITCSICRNNVCFSHFFIDFHTHF